MKVANILKDKGTLVFSVVSSTTVYDALVLMSEKNIGALLVVDDGNLSGILSERDYARKVVLKDKASRETLVSEIMSEKVITVNKEDTIDHCMGLMSKYKFRHLPVVNNGVIEGVLSIGDIVNAIIKKQQETIEHLQSYISQ